MSAQSGILASLPPLARFVGLRLREEADPRPALERLSSLVVDDGLVVGVGHATVSRLGRTIEGLTDPPTVSGRGVSVPSTPLALWCWLRGADRGDLIHRQRALLDLLESAFVVDDVTDAFMHQGGRDLSGYEDGTENPKGDAAVRTAIVSGRGAGLDGGTFVAIQRWHHDLRRFLGHSQQERDHTFGRRHSDNEELADAPPSAHVKRTAQESFTPPAFIWRRSMPWASPDAEGLVFIACATSFQPFEVLLRRMVGLEDGIVDGLFGFTRPVTSSYLFCPPVGSDGRLDLSAIL